MRPCPKGYTKPGMFVQMRTAEDGKPAFIAIASAMDAGRDKFGNAFSDKLEFLIKAGRCRLKHMFASTE